MRELQGTDAVAPKMSDLRRGECWLKKRNPLIFHNPKLTTYKLTNLRTYSMATRHLCRTIVIQSLYEWDFYDEKEELDKIVERNIQMFGADIDEPEFIWRIITGIIEHKKEIDAIIVKAAPEWPIDQIANIDRNILRLGIYELVYADQKEVPHKVAINEAIEVAKNFGGQNSSKFVNGVLGAIYDEISGGNDNLSLKEKESKKIAQKDAA